jgi:hypothetical protein
MDDKIKLARKQKLANRAHLAENFARLAIEADGSFAGVRVIDDCAEHEPGGSCWITVRVKVSDLTIENLSTGRTSATIDEEDE